MVSANPTGPITVASARNGALGDSVARLLEFAGHEVEREYYYNDAGAQMDRFRASVEAVRARRGAARGRLPRRLHRRARRRAGRPGAADARARSRRRWSGSGSTSTRGRARASSSAASSRLLAALPTYEHDGALFVRSTEFGDDKDRVLVRSARKGGHARPTRRPTSPTCATSSSGATTARSTCSAPTTTASPAGTRSSRGCSATTRAGSRCCSTSSSTSTRGGEQTKMSKRRGDVVFLDEFIDEVGVDFARWFLVDRGHDQTIEIDVDLAAERSRKNPVYYVQYVHARISGIFREAPERRRARPGAAAARSRPRSASSSSGSPSSRRSSREATERRGPHAIPVYAIRLADDFHRFYHDARRARREGRRARAVPARAGRRDARRDRPLPRPDRRRRAGADVVPERLADPAVVPAAGTPAKTDRGIRRPRQHGRARRQHRAHAQPARLVGAGTGARVRRVHARARRACWSSSTRAADQTGLRIWLR